MTDFVESIREGAAVLKRADDDMFDRLSNRYTVGFLIVCTLFLATKNYVGDPIDCYTPQEFHDNWVAYADNYCWIKNTYYLPFDKDFGELDERKDIPYYQWVPIIIIFMVFVFSIPVGFWNFAMGSSGYDIETIIKTCRGTESLNPETRDETTQYIVNQLDRHITYHRSSPRMGLTRFLPLGNKYGRYLFIMYVLTKVLYIVVPCFLLWCLTSMMGEGYSDYGLRAAKGVVQQGEYIYNPMFPRITNCDYKIRTKGYNIHKYTTQCLLSVNLFNERIFLLIWWWLIVVCVLSVIGLGLWLFRTLLPNSSKNFVMKYLILMNMAQNYNDEDSQAVKLFADTYLRLDGIFCMRLIARNLLDIAAAEIITGLYKKWKETHYDKLIAGEEASPLSKADDDTVV